MKLPVSVLFFVLVSSFFVVASGNSSQIGGPGDLLELRETVGNVAQTLTELDLDILAGGVILSTEYSQYLRFSQQVSGAETIISPIVNFTENEASTSEVGDYLFILEGTANASQAFFEYELQFEDGLESDIDGNELEELEGENLFILGNFYTVMTARVWPQQITLEMLFGGETATMEEGEARNFTVNGREYRIEILIIEDTTPATVTMKVNGEVTSQLIEGEMERLQDGTFIGVVDIILNEAGESGLGDTVEIILGAEKIRLKDSDFTNSETTPGAANLGFEQTVEINDETIEDAWIQIRGNLLNDNTTFELNSIKYRLVADPIPGQRDIYVAPGHGVREFLDEPQGMLGYNWDIRYEGLEDRAVTSLDFNPQGDDAYHLKFKSMFDSTYDFPLVSNQGGTFKYGDTDDDFVFIEGRIVPTASNISGHTFNVGVLDYFVLSNIDEQNRLDANASTHIVQYVGIDTKNKRIWIYDLATGSQYFIYRDEDIPGVLGSADIVFGGNTYRAYIANLTTDTGNHPLAIDMDADGDVDRSKFSLTTQGGGILLLSNAEESDGASIVADAPLSGHVGSGDIITSDAVNVTLVTLSHFFDENRPPTIPQGTHHEVTNFSVIPTAINRIGLNMSLSAWSSNGGFGLVQEDGNDEYFYGMTDYGALFTLYDPSGTTDPETLSIEYPLLQRTALAFVVGDVRQNNPPPPPPGDLKPPEAIISMSHRDWDFVVEGTDNLDENVDVQRTIIHQNGQQHYEYTLTDDRGNKLVFRLENINSTYKDYLDATMSDLTYYNYNGSQAVTMQIPNVKISMDGFNPELRQHLDLMNPFFLDALYNNVTKKTRIEIREPRAYHNYVEDGFVYAQIVTREGEITYNLK